MVSNINLVKYHYCSEYELIMYALVKYYVFGDTVIRPYSHTPVCPYEGLFSTKNGIFLYTYSIVYNPIYSLHSIYMGIFLQSPQVQPQYQEWVCNCILNLVISRYTPRHWMFQVVSVIILVKGIE